MLALKLRIKMAGEAPVTVPVLPVTQVAFERQYSTGIGQAFSDNIRLEYLYWLGWKSMHHAGHVVKPFDGWLEDVEAVETVDDEAEMRPLAGTPSAG